MAIKNRPGGVTLEQMGTYTQYSREELQHVKNSLATTTQLNNKIAQLLDEVKLCRDFQTGVPRNGKLSGYNDIDQEFDAVIDSLECVIQCIQNHDEELLAADKMVNEYGYDQQFYARR